MTASSEGESIERINIPRFRPEFWVTEALDDRSRRSEVPVQRKLFVCKKMGVIKSITRDLMKGHN